MTRHERFPSFTTDCLSRAHRGGGGNDTTAELRRGASDCCTHCPSAPRSPHDAVFGSHAPHNLDELQRHNEWLISRLQKGAAS
jgi:hypothetical protein